MNAAFPLGVIRDAYRSWVSDPRKLSQIPDDAISEGETRPNWSIGG